MKSVRTPLLNSRLDLQAADRHRRPRQGDAPGQREGPHPAGWVAPCASDRRVHRPRQPDGCGRVTSGVGSTGRSEHSYRIFASNYVLVPGDVDWTTDHEAAEPDGDSALSWRHAGLDACGRSQLTRPPIAGSLAATKASAAPARDRRLGEACQRVAAGRRSRCSAARARGLPRRRARRSDPQWPQWDSFRPGYMRSRIRPTADLDQTFSQRDRPGGAGTPRGSAETPRRSRHA
jgi:hypothetical protein